MTRLVSAPLAPPWHPASAALQIQRATLARQRFFHEGLSPAGQISDLVSQSWQRCMQAGLRPGQAPMFEPVSRSKVNYLAGRDHVLLKAAQRPFNELQATLARSPCKVLLTDREGVLLRVTPPSHEDGPVVRASCRVGVDLGELLVGTNAPSVSARSGAVCTVNAGEHFYDSLAGVRCVAAPIRNRHGVVVAVLDLTVEDQPFRFDARWLVQAYASTIENNLRIAQTRQQVLLRLHSSAAALQQPDAGLAAVDESGRISWLNGLAAALIGVDPVEARQFRAEDLLGCSLEQVLACTTVPAPRPLPLPNGLTVWMQAEYRDLGDGQDSDNDDLGPSQPVAPGAVPAGPAAASAAGAAGAGATLAQIHRQLIDQTLAECHGNVSQAARRLGVSRGLLYRRLREGAMR
jgi:transcriptional regulator of acetoin/glycerol metabolism